MAADQQHKSWTRDRVSLAQKTPGVHISKLRPSSAIRPATAYRWIDASNYPHFVESLLKYCPPSQEFPDSDDSADEDYLPPSYSKPSQDWSEKAAQQKARPKPRFAGI